jgi:superfamily II DNA or RNA helicase
MDQCILVFPSLLLLKQYWKDHKATYTNMPHYYLATDGTLTGVRRLTAGMRELMPAGDGWIVFTTYASAPEIYKCLPHTIDLVAHDEAHHVGAAEYATAWASVAGLVRHTVNLSATLPPAKEAHYKYPLLKGIHDKVVRDFNLELFICTLGERSETSLLITIVNKMRQWHTNVKLLIYTAQANTEGDDASSVKTFLAAHAEKMQKEGWWIKGINEDVSQKDREGLLSSFEKAPEDVAILVSCKTLSEGIDLKGANCMLPWDPTASVVDNIQRIGRVLRLYKKANGENADEQPPSTILIPVFLPEAEYLACGEDREAIDALLSRQIGEGERGNFRPIVNVCTALKSELAEEDADLFNQLLAYPYKPRVSVGRD